MLWLGVSLYQQDQGNKAEIIQNFVMFGGVDALGHINLLEYGACGHIFHFLAEMEAIREDRACRLLCAFGTCILHVSLIWTVFVGWIIKFLYLSGSNLKIFIDNQKRRDFTTKIKHSQ